MGSCTSKPGILQNAVPSPAPTQPSTRSRQLPADVVLMILKLAQGTVLLSDLRVVSRMFDDLIVPIIYSDVTLNPRILACFQESTSQRSAAQGQVVKDICTHTRHVLITKELRWPLVLQLLYSLENLRELSLSYWPPIRDADLSIHYSVFISPHFRAKWPDLRISVQTHDEPMPFLFYPALAKVTNIVSCKSIVSPEVPRWYERGPLIKDALLKNPELEILHLTNNAKDIGDVGWDEQDTREFPPVKELVLRGLLGWNFFGVCNWSRITHLELINVSNLALIKDLPPEKLSGLKTFIIACECWDHGERQSELQELTGFLNTVLSYTTNLDTLAMKCGVRGPHRYRCRYSLIAESEQLHRPNDFVPAIMQHCQSLRSIDLRNFNGPHSLPSEWTLLSVSQLEAIRSSCPRLMELSLDAQTYLHGCQRRLDMDVNATLAKFRNLRRLTVYTIMPYSRPQAGLLPHHQARAVAREWVENLQRSKEGVEFERLAVKIEIERLLAHDGFERIDPEDDWWVCLDYTCEAGNAASWYVTGEERSLEFRRREVGNG